MSPDERAARLEGLLTQHVWVRALARTLVRHDADADDLAQEAWLAALRTPPDGRGSARGWLGAVLRNASRQSHRGDVRRARREDAAARPEAQDSAHEIVSRAEEHRRVVDAVLGLEEPYRTAVLLRFFDDLPPRDVAARTGVPVETARARIRRALERLRERLDAAHGGDGSAWVAALLPLAGLPPGFVATTSAAAAAGPAAPAAPAALNPSLTTSFTTGAITLATTTTVTVGVLALAAGAAIAWLAGGSDREALSKATEDLAAARTAAEQAKSEAAQSRDALHRKDSRISELETELREVRETVKTAESRAASLGSELSGVRAELEKARPGAGTAPRAAGPTFAFAEFAEPFAKVDWKSVAEHTTAILGPLREIVDAIVEGKEIPLTAAGEAQKHNGPLIQAVSVVAGKIPGTGVNGAYTHPAFQVNALAAALEQIGKPLTDSQRTAMEAVGRRFSDEEGKRVAAYGETTYQMQRLVEEGALKDRFFNAVRGVLTPEQLDAVSPPAVRDRTAADLWSEGLFWLQFTRPVQFASRDQMTDTSARIVSSMLKLDDAQKAKASAVVADWTSRLPQELTERKPDALEKAGMMPADLIARAAAETRTLVERLATDLSLGGDQLASARRFGIVLYPFPGGDAE